MMVEHLDKQFYEVAMTYALRGFCDAAANGDYLSARKYVTYFNMFVRDMSVSSSSRSLFFDTDYVLTIGAVSLCVNTSYAFEFSLEEVLTETSALVNKWLGLDSVTEINMASTIGLEWFEVENFGLVRYFESLLRYIVIKDDQVEANSILDEEALLSLKLPPETAPPPLPECLSSSGKPYESLDLSPVRLQWLESLPGGDHLFVTHGVPAGSIEGKSDDPKFAAGIAGERFLAELLATSKLDESNCSSPYFLDCFRSYWSMLDPFDDQKIADVDCVIDFGSSLLLIDVKNYSSRGGIINAMPDGRALFSCNENGVPVWATPMSTSFRRSFDSYLSVIVDRPVEAVVVVLSAGDRTSRLDLASDLVWDLDYRIPVIGWTELMGMLKQRISRELEGVVVPEPDPNLVSLLAGYYSVFE